MVTVAGAGSFEPGNDVIWLTALQGDASRQGAKFAKDEFLHIGGR